MTGAALALAAVALAAAAPSGDASFLLVSSDGMVSVRGTPVRPGRALKPGDELTVGAAAILKNASHVLRIHGPAVVAIARTPNPAISLASGSVLAIRRKPSGRLHVQTPAAGLDLGYAEAYVEPRPNGTYLCVCDAGDGRRKDRHHAIVWSGNGMAPAEGLQGHNQADAVRLRTSTADRRR